MAGIHDFFSGSSVDMKALCEYLDGLPQRKRIDEVTSLSAKEQSRLWDAAHGFRKVTLDDIVPPGTAPLKQVIHHGRNSMPIFTRFQKRFCKPDEPARKDELWGYNHQDLSIVTGPGYYVSKNVDDGEVVIDYREIPPRKPNGWPEILPNSAKLSRFIYYNMEDFLRGVSKHVTIGRATRNGRHLDNWFVLCREE